MHKIESYEKWLRKSSRSCTRVPDAYTLRTHTYNRHASVTNGHLNVQYHDELVTQVAAALFAAELRDRRNRRRGRSGRDRCGLRLLVAGQAKHPTDERSHSTRIKKKSTR